MGEIAAWFLIVAAGLAALALLGCTVIAVRHMMKTLRGTDAD